MEASSLLARLGFAPALHLGLDRLGRDHAVNAAVGLRIQPAARTDGQVRGRPDDIPAVYAKRRRAVKTQVGGVFDTADVHPLDGRAVPVVG